MLAGHFGDDREIFAIEEAVARFDLAKVNPAPTQLPYSKLDWISGQHFQAMSPLELAQAVRPILEAAGFEVNVAALLAMMPAMSVRLKRLTDAIEFLRFLFEERPLSVTAVDLTDKKMAQPAAMQAFRAARDFLAQADPFTVKPFRPPLSYWRSSHGEWQGRPLPGRLRLAITGQPVSPPLFESMVALGRERVVARLDEAIAILAA
jgi:glutamyl-tRNA synthetase